MIYDKEMKFLPFSNNFPVNNRPVARGNGSYSAYDFDPVKAAKEASNASKPKKKKKTTTKVDKNKIKGLADDLAATNKAILKAKNDAIKSKNLGGNTGSGSNKVDAKSASGMAGVAGAIAGGVIGGPLGAAAGAAIGEAIANGDSSDEEKKNKPKTAE